MLNECDVYGKKITECYNFSWYRNIILLRFIRKLKIIKFELYKLKLKNSNEYIINNNSNNNNNNNKIKETQKTTTATTKKGWEYPGAYPGDQVSWR